MFKYSVKVDEGMACAVGVNINASQKQCIQIARIIRRKSIDKAKTFLNNVIAMKAAVPMTRYNGDTGHKTKIGPGRYCIKSCSAVLRVLNNAEANARNKGLNTSSLVVYHVSTKKGSDAWHYGRKRRRKVKQCNFEIVLKETEKKKEEKKGKAAKKETAQKSEAGKAKPEVKKEAVKAEPKKAMVAEKKEVIKKEQTAPVEKKEQPVAEKPKQEVVKKEETKPVEKKENPVQKVEEKK